MRKISGVVAVLALAALIVSVTVLPASAATHKAVPHKTTKKHKKKKKKKAAPIVKCAATLICPSHPGATGPQGPAGKDGTNGTNGANGTAIVARARSAGAVTPNECTSSCPDQNDPLTGNTWTQAPTENDHMVGSWSWTNPPAACLQSDGTTPGYATLQVLLDGQVVSSQTTPDSTAGNAGSTPQPTPLFFGGGIYSNDFSNVMETGSANNHTLTAKVSDNCHTGGHFKINAVGVDVESFK